MELTAAQVAVGAGGGGLRPWGKERKKLARVYEEGNLSTPEEVSGAHAREGALPSENKSPCWAC